MELLFIRHAQPEWVTGDGMSVLDPVLTTLGRTQAEHLGARARNWTDIDEIWVSPTNRTRETAAPIVEATGIVPLVYDWLEEIRLPPQWDGVSAHHMGPAFAAARTRPAEQWWNGIAGGEAFTDFHRRVTEGFDAALTERGVRVIEANDLSRVYEIEDHDKRVAVVGHGGTCSVLLAHLLQIPAVPWSWERFVLMHASVSRLRSTKLLGGRIFGMREMSDVAHLPTDLVTR